MVDEFSTKSRKYNFKIDGKAHTLPALSFGDFERFTEAEDDGIRADMMREILFRNAPKRTSDAIRTLAPEDVGDLFRKYAGLTPGESSASAE